MLPSYSIPPEEFKLSTLPASFRKQRELCESNFGKLVSPHMTIEIAPLVQVMGSARVIDIRDLLLTEPDFSDARTTDVSYKGAWKPNSPIISLELVKGYEAKTKAIRDGEVVLFWSGYPDQFFKPLPALPEVDRMFAAPLSGKAQGWPTPSLEVLNYLAEKGVRCIGTDGPTMGGVDADHALMVHWLAASKNVFLVEFLTNLQSLANRSDGPGEGGYPFFVFAPVKIRGTVGGYGRALGLY